MTWTELFYETFIFVFIILEYKNMYTMMIKPTVFVSTIYVHIRIVIHIIMRNLFLLVHD